MDATQIGQVRSFDRTVSQRIGALDQNFLDRGRPLGEARLIYEIGRDGAELRELRARLELDSGYLSRLLGSLARQGLVTVRPSRADARVRRATLTRKGQREHAELDRRSDAFAASVLAPLSPSRRDRLVAAMSEVERLVRASAVRVGVEAPDSADARYCIQCYFDEIAARFDTGFDPRRSIAVRADELVPPTGVFLLARLHGAAIGCGALRAKDRRFGEIKRVWVRPDMRGLGVARRLVEALEAQAREFGLRAVRLDTNRTLKEAQALYRSCGYREIARFNAEPYAHHWFEKALR